MVKKINDLYRIGCPYKKLPEYGSSYENGMLGYKAPDGRPGAVKHEWVQVCADDRYKWLGGVVYLRARVYIQHRRLLKRRVDVMFARLSGSGRTESSEPRETKMAAPSKSSCVCVDAW